ncbi:MAG: dockerin type I repeat-containing protein [Clostridia bacterium]|nr:dockerin type I repeat-containing protein [Clostridia bacterium]
MKKKILALVLVLAIVMSMFALSFTTSAASTLKGDANGDGEVSANDALLVLRAAAGIEDSLSPEAKTLCDIDGDGFISLFDARKILRAAAGLTNLEPTGAFKGYIDENNIFSSKEVALNYFNTNINKIKSQRYGFTVLTDVEMKEFGADKITIFGQPASNSSGFIERIFEAVGSESDQEIYIMKGQSSTNIMSVEGQSYVSKLNNADVYGAKVEYDATRYTEAGGVITISIAIPDAEKWDIYDSSYIRVFNTDNLLGATESILNSMLTRLSNDTEIIHYKNAVLVAEFEAETGYPISYSTSYETSVYVESATSSIYSLEGINYETLNKVDYVDFIYD